MSTSHEFVSELARDITSAVAEKEWASVSADLTVLAEQVVQALIDHREQDVKNAYEAVESAYSTLVTGFQVEDSVADAKSAASELRAYTRLLSVALAYRSSPAIQEIALDHRFRPLLEKLLPWPDGMSGRELAKALYVRPETIARKLRLGGGFAAAGIVPKLTHRNTACQCLIAMRRGDNLPLSETVRRHDAYCLIRKSSIARATASGDSIRSPCPVFSRTTSSACRIPRTSCRENSTGNRMSSSPTTTKVGQFSSLSRPDELNRLIASD